MCASQDKFLLDELIEFIKRNEKFNFFPQDFSKFYKEYYVDEESRSQENAILIIIQLMLMYNLPIDPRFINILYKTETMLEHRVEIKRDHVLHTLNVCVLGCFIMETQEGKLGLPFEVENIKNWLFASIFHDIGYFNKSPQTVILRKDVESVLNDHQARIISVLGYATYFSTKHQYDEKVYKEKIEKYSTDFQKKIGCDFIDHGIMSIEILNCIESISDIPYFEKSSFENNKINCLSTIDWNDFKKSKQAISYHNRINDCSTLTAIDLEKNPLISLLHIVDELQDYDRKYLNSEENDYLKIDDVRVGFDDGYIIFKFPKKAPQIKSPVKEKLNEYKIRIETIEPEPQSNNEIEMKMIRNEVKTKA